MGIVDPRSLYLMGLGDHGQQMGRIHLGLGDDVGNSFSRVLGPRKPARYWHVKEPCRLYLAPEAMDSKWEGFTVVALGRVFFLAGGLDAAEAKPEGYGEWIGPVFETPTSKVVDVRSRHVMGRGRDDDCSRKESEFVDPVDDLTLVMEVWKARIYHYGRDDIDGLVDKDGKRDPKWEPNWHPREFVEGTWLPKGFDNDDHSGSVALHGLELLGPSGKKDALLRGAHEILHRVFRLRSPHRPKKSGHVGRLTVALVQASYKEVAKVLDRPTQAQVAAELSHKTPFLGESLHRRSLQRFATKRQEATGIPHRWPPTNWPS